MPKNLACLVVPLQGEYSVIPVTQGVAPGLLCELRFQRTKSNARS
jgi:hypothetical protein